MNQEGFNRSVFKMGAQCVLITGCCYLVIAGCALLSPKPIASYVASEDYFVDFESYKHYFVVLKYLMCLANASMVGVVISLYHIKKHPPGGWFILFTLLSIIGLGIGMLQSVLDATQIPHLALQYEKAPPIIRHVMIAFGVADPAIYILSLGLPGIWLIFLNYLHRKEFSPFLVFLGVLWGLGNIVTVIAHLFIILWLIYFIAGSALIGVPLWTIFQGRYLWKLYKK
ncbi:MAG: hypothetical protein FJZ59_05045 [Chlamydiae bacterium]|jgi:hypothetical protein|nr:hypothetical protein [Chlamydiota bacterium]